VRARNKVEEINKLAVRARANYLQLGGKKEDIEDAASVKERSLMKYFNLVWF
jgi:hypothetical protein